MNKNISCENCQARRRKFAEKEYSCWLDYEIENNSPKCGDCPQPKNYGEFCRALITVRQPIPAYYLP